MDRSSFATWRRVLRWLSAMLFRSALRAAGVGRDSTNVLVRLNLRILQLKFEWFPPYFQYTIVRMRCTNSPKCLFNISGGQSEVKQYSSGNFGSPNVYSIYLAAEAKRNNILLEIWNFAELQWSVVCAWKTKGKIRIVFLPDVGFGLAIDEAVLKMKDIWTI